MADEVPLRITVLAPPPGVAWAVQSGRSELIKPSRHTVTEITFDVIVRIGRSQADGTPSLLGAVAQGPPASRFIYVNSGGRAGQPDSCWDRRAKIPLMGISSALLKAVRTTPGARLEARIIGTVCDGGPACATVPLLDGGWRLITPTAA
jgi:hypothetical protein